MNTKKRGRVGIVTANFGLRGMICYWHLCIRCVYKQKQNCRNFLDFNRAHYHAHELNKFWVQINIVHELYDEMAKTLVPFYRMIKYLTS